MRTLHPQIHLTDSRFNYISSAKTDISLTFERIRQDLKFSEALQSQKKPLVSLPLNPEGFVLPAEWFDLV